MKNTPSVNIYRTCESKMDMIKEETTKRMLKQMVYDLISTHKIMKMPKKNFLDLIREVFNASSSRTKYRYLNFLMNYGIITIDKDDNVIFNTEMVLNETNTHDSLFKDIQDFLKAYKANRAKLSEHSTDADSVDVILTCFMKNRHVWEGTTSQLIVELAETATSLGFEPRKHKFLESPSILGKLLKEIKCNLAQKDIIFEYVSKNKRRIINKKYIYNNKRSLISDIGRDDTYHSTIKQLLMEREDNRKKQYDIIVEKKVNNGSIVVNVTLSSPRGGSSRWSDLEYKGMKINNVLDITEEIKNIDMTNLTPEEIYIKIIDVIAKACTKIDEILATCKTYTGKLAMP